LQEQVNTGLLPEVVEFDAFEEEYGHHGNWHEEDHAEFVRVLRSNKGDYAATVFQCSESMVGFDRLDVLAHARWHSKYVELGMRKKLAVQQWRQDRSEQQRRESEAAHAAVPVPISNAQIDPKKCVPCTSFHVYRTGTEPKVDTESQSHCGAQQKLWPHVDDVMASAAQRHGKLPK
jgi:hypothetical protein